MVPVITLMATLFCMFLPSTERQIIDKERDPQDFYRTFARPPFRRTNGGREKARDQSAPFGKYSPKLSLGVSRVEGSGSGGGEGEDGFPSLSNERMEFHDDAEVPGSALSPETAEFGMDLDGDAAGGGKDHKEDSSGTQESSMKDLMKFCKKMVGKIHSIQIEFKIFCAELQS